MDETTPDFGNAIAYSHIVGALDRFQAAYKTSRMAAIPRWFDSALIDRLTDTTKHSLIYCWLTTEPDPDVIVINLRETYTVGPFVAFIERTTTLLAPAWRNSVMRKLGDRPLTLHKIAAGSRLCRSVVGLFEPPERRK